MSASQQVIPVAMHMSDGIVDARTSALFAVLAFAGLVLCVRRARGELDERTVPLAGLVAAFVFAVQMVNFPILPGVSGHLLGGALAAILVGPYTGALCIAIVLIVQSLLFADGGISALGTNITNMALIGTFTGYAVAVVGARLCGLTRGDRGDVGGRVPIGIVAWTSAFIGTLAAATGFVVQYALGGVASNSLHGVAGYMWGTHALIGVGEGLITAITVTAVARSRPDLIYLTRMAPSRVDSGTEVSA